MPNGQLIKFETTKSKQLQYFDITNEGIFSKISNRNRTEFWDGIFDEHKHHWNISFDFQSAWNVS